MRRGVLLLRRSAPVVGVGKLFIYCHQLVNFHRASHSFSSSFFFPLTAAPGGMITGDLLAGARRIHIFLIEEFIPEQVVADFLVFFFTGYEGCRHIVGVGIARASIFFVSEMIRITAN